jgi:flavin-binding protein dodecin
MSDNVYSVTELVGSSSKSMEDAISNAIETASKSLKHIEWFEVISTRGHVEGGKVGHFQVGLKIGFRYDK